MALTIAMAACPLERCRPTAQALLARAHRTARAALAQRLRDERALQAKEAALLAATKKTLQEDDLGEERRELEALLHRAQRRHAWRAASLTRLEAELAPNNNTVNPNIPPDPQEE